MKRAFQIGIGLLIFTGLIVIVFIGAHTAKAPVSPANSNTEEAQVREQVEAFGKTLQRVSVLAPDASTTIATTYAPYVTSDLLTTWETSPESAPGKLTSSPWPDRIEISNVQKTGEGYEVQGSIILMTSNEVQYGGDAGITPIILELKKESGAWKINSFLTTDPD